MMPPFSDPRRELTEIHLELLALLASGHNLTTIAEMKFMHLNTVRYQLHQARERVGAKSLTQLALLAFEAGMIRRNGNQGHYKPALEERVIG